MDDRLLGTETKRGETALDSKKKIIGYSKPSSINVLDNLNIGVAGKNVTDIISVINKIGTYIPIPDSAKISNPPKRAFVYDIEVFPNLFLVCFRQVIKDGKIGQGKQFTFYQYEDEQGVIHGNLGELWSIVENSLLIGYHSKSFDNPLLCYVLDCLATDRIMHDNKVLSLYWESDIVSGSDGGYKNDNEERMMLKGNHFGTCSNYYDTAQLLINGEPDRFTGEMRFPYKFKKFKTKPYFKFIDLMEICREGYNIKSLKLIGVNLMHDKLQDLPYKFDTKLDYGQVNKVLHYCWNDIDITEKLYHYLKPRIDMRIGLGKLYNIDCITEADSGIVNIINDKFYTEASGIPLSDLSRLRTLRHYDIPIWSEGCDEGDRKALADSVFNGKVSYRTEYMQTFLEELKTLKIQYKGKLKEAKKDDTKEYIFPHYNDDSITDTMRQYVVAEGRQKNLETKGELKDYIKAFTLNTFGVKFTVGLGGIHTIDEAGLLEEDDEFYLIDIDVDSFYPRAVIVDGICPAHLDEDMYIAKYIKIVETRLDAKAKTKLDNGESITYSIINAGLKICINGEYGKYNYKFYWLYDPLCTFKVTLNNQLRLLQLCEDIYLDGHVIASANTDGVTVKVRKDKGNKSLQSFRDTWGKWCEDSGFTMEEVRYRKIVRKDINNYMVVIDTDNDGNPIKPKVKSKGSYFDKDSLWNVMKGFTAPIISVALHYYYVDGIPVEDTIKEFIKDWKNNPLVEKECRGYHPIHWYCIANKIDKSYTNVIQPAKKIIVTHSPKTGNEYKRPKIEWVIAKDIPTQSTCRYYMHKPTAGDGTIGTLLTKRREVGVVDKETGEVTMETTYTAHQKNEFVKLFNDVEYKDDWEDYEINFDWYIDQCNKVIEKIEKVQ